MKLAPIVLFVYNRPWHLKQTVESLAKNELALSSDLIIFSDGPKVDSADPIKSEAAISQVEEVRNYIRGINGFKSRTIIESETNSGLANSIIRGVTRILREFETTIVLEDDMLLSPYFLKYMNDALQIYHDSEDVISIHGYIYPLKKKLPETFFLKGADCWGWATWRRGWDMFEEDGKLLLKMLDKEKLKKEFDFNNSFSYYKMLEDQVGGINDSWAIRWYASAFIKDKYTLYPGNSFVNNIGFDNSGTHCSTFNKFDCEVAKKPIKIYKIDVIEDKYVRKQIEKYFRSLK